MVFARRIVAITLFACLFSWTLARGQSLRIYHVDVEQADATLFVSPGGNTLLVDGGKNGHGDRIEAVMDRAGVSAIDHFVATHYHEDHYGGIDDIVADGIEVRQAYDRGDKAFLPQSKLQQRTYIDYQRAVGSMAEHITRGEPVDLDPDLSVVCISSGGVVLGEEPPVPGKHENDLSVSLLIQYGDFRYFIGGHIAAATEHKIAQRDLVRNVDVYQANHHGSHTSSARPFMEDLNPSVIVISNGNTSRYKHRRKVTLETFASLPSDPLVLQTNKYLHGSTVAGNVADEFIGDPESVDKDGTIEIVVPADADEYMVSYEGHHHTIAVKNRGEAGAPVVIESVLPNPVGSDRMLEEITLRNDGTQSVDIIDWILSDESGRIWTLAATDEIPAGEAITVVRRGMDMSLNNDGDTVQLTDSRGHTRDTFSYEESSEGERILTGH